MFRLYVPRQVSDLIRGMHPDLKKKIRAALDDILDDPGSGKPLKDDLAGLISCRVGRIRIIYRIPKSDRIDIVAIGPREIIYEETYRLIKREQTGDR